MTPEVKQRINFYVAEFHPPTLPRPVQRLLVSLVISVLASLLLAILMWWLASSQQQQLERWQQQRLQLSEQLQQLEDSLPPLTEDKDLLNQQQQLHQQAIAAQAVLNYLSRGELEESQSFTRLLHGLGAVANQGVWLQTVRIAEGGGSLALSGYLQQPQQLSAYVAALLKQPGYRGKAFRHIQIEEVEQQPWLQFELASDAIDVEGDNG